MPILLKNPGEVGADRIVNAVAAFDRYRQSLIVVDFGTATTFDAISEKGEYLGGAISPGIGIASEALFLKASKLPRVEIFSPPENVIDKIVEGKLNKFYEESCLLNQPYVRDTDISIADLLNQMIAKIGENISIKRFVRYQIGES